MVDQLKRKCVERVHTGKGKGDIFRVPQTQQPARVDVVSWHRQCLSVTGHLQHEYWTAKLDAEVDCLVVDAKVFVIQKVEIFLNNVAKSCVHMFQVVHIFKVILQQFQNLQEHQIRQKMKLHIKNLQD